MDEPRDDVDIWLSERVKPLLPHPGTFERIRKRARRRKLGQAAMAAAGAAVIVAAAVTVPQLVPQLTNGPGPATHVSATATPTRTHSTSPSPTASSSSPASNIPPSGPPPVPPNFAVSSVTFFSVSPYIGWVIGQAGTPGHCGPPKKFICTSRAITSNGGFTWQGGHAPVAGPPKGAYGVSQVRALDGTSAWAFGPQLYATHDRGYTWTPINTSGMRVVDLETVHHHAFAIWARCTGTGSAFAANCTSFSLYSTPAGSDQWAPVTGAANLSVSPATGLPAVPASAQLVLTNTTGYLLAPNGDVYSGPVTGGAWHAAATQGTPAGCLPGRAQRNGVPSQTMLATTGAGIVELCAATGSAGTQVKTLRYSADGGLTWQPAGTAPLAGIATSLSGTPGGRVVVATTAGIDVSVNVASSGPTGLGWRNVQGASPPGGFSYVGMTSDGQGVAIPANKALHAVWFTYDGGSTWHESAVRS